MFCFWWISILKYENHSGKQKFMYIAIVLICMTKCEEDLGIDSFCSYMSVLKFSRSCISDGFSNHHDILFIYLFI